MYTLIIATGILGFYFLYNTSAKMKMARQGAFALWIASGPVRARAIGIACLLACVITLVVAEGLGVGLFTFLLLLMAGSSLVITLIPLRLLQARYVIPGFVIAFLLETIIFR